MSLQFRPEMKTIVHEVDGEAVSVIGKSIDGSSGALVAMVEATAGIDRLRRGARVRCSYVDHSGVHEFTSTITSAEGLALNHRLVRLTVAAPSEAQRHQRREHVRVPYETPIAVTTPDGEVHLCTTVDLSAGGTAVCWPEDSEVVDVGEMVMARFRSDRFDHTHDAITLGTYQRGKVSVVRMRFEGITQAGRERLASVVFAVQREERRRHHDGKQGR